MTEYLSVSPNILLFSEDSLETKVDTAHHLMFCGAYHSCDQMGRNESCDSTHSDGQVGV